MILGEAERVLLDAVSGDDGDHAGQRLGAAGVDAHHARVRVQGPEYGPVGQARQREIVEELRVSRDLVGAVELRGRLADDVEGHCSAPYRWLRR
jgi:hypothetical protein